MHASIHATAANTPGGAPRGKAWLRAAAALLLAAAPLVALAQAYPNKPIRFINNFPSGGPSDILARAVGEAVQTALKQPVVVENKPGAAGNLGADQVAKSPGDGYTVLFSIDTTFTINPHIYKSTPFKLADFKPVMLMASSGLLVGVHPSTGFKMLKDLVAAGKTRALNFSSAGSGSPWHLAVEIFMDAAGVHIQHVLYKGNAPAVTAVFAGEVDAGVLATPGMLYYVRTGKITALAVTSRQRSRLAPEIPAVAEARLKDLEIEVLYLAFVPASTPDAVVQTLQKAFAEALRWPEAQTRLNSMEMHYEGLVGADVGKRLAEASQRYGRIIRATGMKVE